MSLECLPSSLMSSLVVRLSRYRCCWCYPSSFKPTAWTNYEVISKLNVVYIGAKQTTRRRWVDVSRAWYLSLCWCACGGDERPVPADDDDYVADAMAAKRTWKGNEQKLIQIGFAPQQTRVFALHRLLISKREKCYRDTYTTQRDDTILIDTEKPLTGSLSFRLAEL